MINPKKITLPIFPRGMFIFIKLLKVLLPTGTIAKIARSIPTRPSPAIKPEQYKIPFSEDSFLLLQIVLLVSFLLHNEQFHQ